MLTAAVAAPLRTEPVLWLDPRGGLRLNGEMIRGRFSPGASPVRTPLGMGLDLSGRRSGLLLPDRAELTFPDSLTISTWVYPRRYAANGWQAQIVFRGDDRAEFDGYSLCLQSGGTVRFRRDGVDGVPTTLETELPVKRWTHVTASYDGETGEIRLWIGDRLNATRTTDRRVFARLDGVYAPGVGIGNVQNDRGPHNQPLDGMIVDLRLYDRPLDPAEAGYRPGLDRGGA